LNDEFCVVGLDDRLCAVGCDSNASNGGTKDVASKKVELILKFDFETVMVMEKCEGMKMDSSNFY
jgi:hypothetical protein